MPANRAQAFVDGVLLFVLVVSVPGGAQSPSNSSVADQQQVWDFGIWGAEAIGKEDTFSFGQARITMAGFHVGRVFHRTSPDSGLRRTWEYTLDLQPLLLVTRPQHAYGGGFAPVGLKWNFAPRGRYRPYLEFNGGAMFTQKNIPPGNTSAFNFTAALGPGVTMAVSRTQAVSFALRWWHLSNGGIGVYNPSFNTLEFVIAYHWLTFGHPSHQQLSGTPANTQARQ